MASLPRKVVTKRNGVKWRIHICVNRLRESHTAETKAEALRWALDREAELSSGRILVKGRTLGDALLKYSVEISPAKKGARWEILRLNKLARDPIANIRTDAFCLRDAEQFRDRSLETLAPNTVIRELTILKSVAKQCVKWSWMREYPLEGLADPKAPRVMRPIFTPDEIGRIAAACGLPLKPGARRLSAAAEVGVLFLLALETGMRLSEMTSLERNQVDIDARVVHLKHTKNGDERDVALSERAVDVISWLPARRSRLFKVSSGTASTTFRKLRKRAGVEGKTFHRTRHTAITNLAKVFEPFELAKQVGHRNINQTLEYYNLSASELAGKL